jgi:hypothetical protein
MKLTTIDFTPLIYKVLNNCGKDSKYKEDFSYYKQKLQEELDTILEVTKADYYYAFMDGETSFRKEKFDTFKGNRIKSYVLFKSDLIHYAKEELKIIYSNIFESDDLCALYSNLKYVQTEEDLVPDQLFLGYCNTHRVDNCNYANPDITIATIDSDFNQLEATLYWNNNWQIITKEQSEFNLWKSVLIKGHNNKLDYLEGCGEDTANKYLEHHKEDLSLAVLKAYMYGIDKLLYPEVRKSIQGYGIIEGPIKFSRAYEQTYLLRTLEEFRKYDENYELILPNKVNKNGEGKQLDNLIF